ncbi:hypothetical protein GCM10017667_33260 [Streptomyces filamentosus]|uniref:Uncharacterized protein n=2 Tax=Streptomyces filamentosus TaxID=67294 RepID=A0A919BMZ1_STRFL|nr:hypothetical protein GCM10017667_33260 [Streptomyces filamentosus]
MATSQRPGSDSAAAPGTLPYGCSSYSTDSEVRGTGGVMSGSLVLRRFAPLVALLAVLLALAFSFAGALLAGGPDGFVGAAVGAAVAVAAASVVRALVGARTSPAVPPALIRTALRDRARRTAFLPQRDPDAAGRRRPRAPGRPLPAAA